VAAAPGTAGTTMRARVSSLADIFIPWKGT
jgi:hypothetical protein